MDDESWCVLLRGVRFVQNLKCKIVIYYDLVRISYVIMLNLRQMYKVLQVEKKKNRANALC